MEVKTAGRVIFIGNNSGQEDKDIFLPASGPDADGPPSDKENTDSSSIKKNADALARAQKKTKLPSDKEKKDRAKKGQVWNAVKGVWEQAKDTGIVGALLGKIGLGGRNSGGGSSAPPVDVQEGGGDNSGGGSGSDSGQDSGGGAKSKKEDEGWSTTTKVLVGVGALAVITTIIVIAAKGGKRK